MQAQTIDSLERLAYYLLKVNGNDPSEPATVPRPGVSNEPRTVSLSEFNNILRG